MITKIVMSMTEFTEHYPTGAIAYNGEEVVDSDFCDTAEEFENFIGSWRSGINSLTRLEVEFDARDLVYDPGVTEAMMEIVKDVTDWFYDNFKK